MAVTGHEAGESSPYTNAVQKLREIAVQLDEDGARVSSYWVRWAADEIESVRLQNDLRASLELR